MFVCPHLKCLLPLLSLPQDELLRVLWIVTSLTVQWWRLPASSARGVGSISLVEEPGSYMCNQKKSTLDYLVSFFYSLRGPKTVYFWNIIKLTPIMHLFYFKKLYLTIIFQIPIFIMSIH